MSVVDMIAALGTVAHLVLLTLGDGDQQEHGDDADCSVMDGSRSADGMIGSSCGNTPPLESSEAADASLSSTESSTSGTPSAFLLYGGGLIATSLILAVLYNFIAWYKFVVAWNLILRARRMDLAGARLSSSSKSTRKQQHLSSRAVSETFTTPDGMSQHLTCPICLTDFYEQELVTQCDGDDGDGCGNWFHHACLVEWLDRGTSDDCPCCRKDMLHSSRQPKQTSMWGGAVVLPRCIAGLWQH